VKISPRIRLFTFLGPLAAGLALCAAFALTGHDGPAAARAASSPSPGSVAITSPNGGEGWGAGTPQTVSWRFTGVTAAQIAGGVRLELLKAGRFHSLIASSAPAGSGSAGSYAWELPLFMADGSEYRVRIEASEPSSEYPFYRTITDDSDADFSIASNGRIVFASTASGSTTSDVFLLDENGTRRLTSDPAYDNYPALSPGWNKVAFASRRDGNFEIYVVNADGTGLLRLTTNAAEDEEPAWSPDGGRIAFCSNRDGDYEIYVMRSDGSALQRLTESAQDDKSPVFSPDGSKIAFASSREGNYEVFVMNADGTGQHRLTSNIAFDFEPAWSPDGTKIAFASKRDGDFEIYVMSATGSDQRRLASSPAEDRHPSWSPDGRKIVFYSKQSGYFDLYVVNSAGGPATALTTTNAPDWDPNWSPRRPLRFITPLSDKIKVRPKIRR